MERFIVINGRILDFSIYRNDFSLMRRIILLDQKEYFRRLGFERILCEKKPFYGLVAFYNPALDMEISITLSKKSKLQFV